MSEPKVIAAARAMLRGYYNCEPLPMLAEQLADTLAEWRPVGETPIDGALLAETQRCLREATAENEQLRAALAEQEVECASIPGTNVRVRLPSRLYDAGSYDQQMTPAVQRVLDAADKRAQELAEREVEQEPVAYLYTYHGPEGWDDRLEFPGARWQGPGYNHMPNNWREAALYTATRRREWQGLTDEEVLMAISPDLHHHIEGAERETRLADARAIEAALKERNHD